MTGWSYERGSEAEWERPIRALLLDVDDTLVDTQAAMRHSCRVGAVAAWPDEAPEVHTAISDVFYDDPGGHFNAYTRGEQAFDEMRHNRYARAVTGLGLRDVGFDVFEAAYLQEFGQAQHLFDDVMPMLAVARENEVAESASRRPDNGRASSIAEITPRVKLLPVGLENTVWPWARTIATSILVVVVLPLVPLTTTIPPGTSASA